MFPSESEHMRPRIRFPQVLSKVPSGENLTILPPRPQRGIAMANTSPVLPHVTPEKPEQSCEGHNRWKDVLLSRMIRGSSCSATTKRPSASVHTSTGSSMVIGDAIVLTVPAWSGLTGS